MTQEQQGSVVIVSLAGQLDTTAATELGTGLLAEFSGVRRQVILYCEHLSYISSAGLRILLTLHKRLQILHGTVVLASLQAPVRKIFELTGFVNLFPIYETRDEAIRFLAARESKTGS
jgi:anti-anti-sigma factor